ncbi:putative flavoprotein YhiN [Methanolinea mesophila]|uniref:NAD(P)/FAD-dependent oxidoreductase n=1 Tax=Methanolinea mesophila TaxID=547055 RepID=UPI001FD77C13|nr:NAD(P)/FAD-dependent oxidoreductase [Methanolinea mesophila]MBP1929927.1 putative flavoprotein YhiN [Methanolinea mesophila]
MEHVRETGVLVIGGGPAGLFCAISCGLGGRSVVLLEKMPSCGRKLLITGSGQCNLTHEGDISDFFIRYGDHGKFIRPALKNFTNRDLVTFFESRGLPMVTLPGGKIFPRSMKASDVLATLLAECGRAGVDLRCGERVCGVTRKEGKFLVSTQQPGRGGRNSTTICEDPGRRSGRTGLQGDWRNNVAEQGRTPGTPGSTAGFLRDGAASVSPEKGGDDPRVYSADHLVLATGGASYPSTGSTGDGYDMMRALGHPVTEIGPALVPVVVERYPFADLAGISFGGVGIAVFRSGRKLTDRTGDLLFTHEGLSGPGILDLSRYLRPGDQLRVSFLPGRSREAVEEFLIGVLGKDGSRQVRNVLREMNLPERFARRLPDLAGIPPDRTCAHVTRKERNDLMDMITGFPFSVRDLAGFDQAMVTRGGAALEAIDPRTMGSRPVPGLSIIGEALDIDGDTGGYNLQAAFSTAALAAAALSGRQGQVSP